MSPLIGVLVGWLATPSVGGILATALILTGIVGVWVGATAGAPLRQRNEARRELSARSTPVLRIDTGALVWSAVGGPMQGKAGVWMVQVTVTNTSETSPMGVSRVWLRLEEDGEESNVEAIALGYREAVKPLMGLPTTADGDISPQLYLQPLQAESGTYQFLDMFGRSDAHVTFFLQDSRGVVVKHEFTAWKRKKGE